MKPFYIKLMAYSIKCMFNLNRFKSKRNLSQFSKNIHKLIEIMPKDNSKLVNKLRETRLKNANKTEQLNKYPSNVVKLNILGNGSPGNPRAVFITTDRMSYLFNCGEGTQRLCHEYSFKLAKLEHIFFTRRCAENFGGLVGLTLTCQDIGVPSLTFHGPTNIDQFLDLYKPFIAHLGMQLHSHNYLDKNFEDIEMQIQCIPIFKSNSLLKSNCDQLLSDEIAFVYACKLQTLPGQLLVDKCIELRIPPGPLLGLLKSGKDVVLRDNRTIYSKDVVGPEEIGPIFLILECPSIDHIDSLVNNEQLLPYQSEESEFAKLVSVIVHFSPPEVISDERYRDWMKAFDESVTHITCNSECDAQNFQSAYRLQSQLNLIDPKVFPLLKTASQINDSSYLGTNIIKSPSLLKYQLRPSAKRGLDNEDVIIIDNQEKINDTLSNEQFSESLEKYRSLLFSNNDNIKEYPEIIFLGTGSAIPSKVRNTSAIWVNIRSNTSLLLDCGEGTCGQIYRFFGDDFESRLKSLKAIYISHLHADHHLGLLQIIKSRSLVTKDPIILLVPPHVKSWLDKYNNTVENISQFYTYYLNDKFCNNIYPDILEKLNLIELKTTFVKHCNHSYGISFKTANPIRKIVYSGDAMPTKSLIEIGRNCDLLIHEATMEDDLADEAKLKCHSTTSDAINMGIKMNAKYTILTHFSQRYSKVPLFNEKFNDKVGIAFDNMRLTMSDLEKLPFMISTIKCLFSHQIDEMEAITAHKKRRKELLNKYIENINT